MPKQKTNKSAAKRFKVTKNGKVRRFKAGRRHLMSVKPGKKKRHLRDRPNAAPGDARVVKALLGDLAR